MRRLAFGIVLFTASLIPATGCKPPSDQPAEKKNSPPESDTSGGKKSPSDVDEGKKAPLKKTQGPESLPKDVVVAWEGAKWRETWMRARRGYAGRINPVSDNPETGDIPAFRFSDTWNTASVAKLPEPPSAFGIQATPGEMVTESFLKDLARFKNLHGLGLALTSIKDYKALGQLTSLRWLDLTGCSPDDAAVKDLVGLKNLQLLNVGTSKVSDAGLKELAGLTELQSLDLHRTKITDNGLKELANFKKLKLLNVSSVLGESKVTDAGMKYIAALDLQMLFLNGTKVTDVGVKELAPCKSLHLLWLNDNDVTDASSKTLSGFTELKELSLGFTNVTDETVKDLAKLTKLQNLSLTNTKTSDAGLKALASLKNLRELYISGTKTTDAGVAELKKALPGCEISR
jgi:internalin A